jgi:hypothetical protein
VRAHLGEQTAACPECQGPLSGLGPVSGRRWGRKRAEPSNGYCLSCHVGFTNTDHHWARTTH